MWRMIENLMDRVLVPLCLTLLLWYAIFQIIG
jgi:hypothetical protein